MIARPHRFHGYNALRHVYGRGQTVRGTSMAIKYVQNQRRSSYRAAVVVSRKVHKSAVIRNRIRRRIYEVIRKHAQDIARPYDIVVTVYGDQYAEMPAGQVEAAMSELLQKSGITGSPVPSGSHAIVEPKEQ